MASLTSVQRDQYRRTGRLEQVALVSAELLAPVREFARAIALQAPDQDLLSGVHNPFGHHVCTARAWSFLDLAEDAALLDLVEDVLGPDIILWDSELYFDLSTFAPDEGQYWPVEPLAGTIAGISLEQGEVGVIDVNRLAEAHAGFAARGSAQYIVRYMPASSHFNRDPLFPPNRRAAEYRPLVNYAKRPLWLVRGEDRGNNDFVAGFLLPTARWADAGWNQARHGAGDREEGD
jgi:hypothetical protein